MKTKVMNSIAFPLALLVCSIAKASGTSEISGMGVRSNSTDTVVQIQPRSFTKISSDCVMNISFEVGNTYTVAMEGKKKYVRNISVKTEEGTLHFKRIEERQNDKDDEKVDVRITAPCLEEFFSQGVGNLKLSGEQEDTNLIIRVRGVSNVNLEGFKTRNLEIVCSGVGNLNWDHLECKDFRLEKSGVSNANGARLDCTSFSLVSSGVGDTTIDQIRCQRLNSRKSGVGKIHLKDVDCDVLSLKNSGQGKMIIGGKANKATMEDSTRRGLDTSSLKIKNK